MSRVGKKLIPIPEKTQVAYEDGRLTVKGPKGSLTRTIHPAVQLDVRDTDIAVAPTIDDSKSRAFQGLFRSLISNMVIGVDQGFERVLEITGIGYRAEVKGRSIVFNLGYSHPVNFQLPEGITAEVEKNNIVKLFGIDKELLGQTAASIRGLRPPEPYKGKGVKFKGEYIQRKAGKAGAK
jgi:large subunit ribosomal protein L6